MCVSNVHFSIHSKSISEKVSFYIVGLLSARWRWARRKDFLVRAPWLDAEEKEYERNNGSSSNGTLTEKSPPELYSCGIYIKIILCIIE